MAVRVRFLASCLVEILRPDVAAAAERVLRAAGCAPQPVRGATCCGQPAYNAGYGAEARRVARRTLRALSADGDETPCVVASGSCATMIAHHWPELFEGTAEETAAGAVAARTFELTGFLTRNAAGVAPAGVAPAGSGDHPAAGSDGPSDENPDAAEPGREEADERGQSTSDPRGTGSAGGEADEGGQTGAEADGSAPASTDGEDGTGTAGAEAVVIHDSCHAMRELGAGATVRRALAGAGRRAVSAEGTERCCGFGGSFSVKMPGVSVAMADEKLDNFAATGCRQVTSCDLSCLLHLQGRAARRGLDLRFDHVATVLDQTPAAQ